jgi:hypothetical protein
VPWPESAICVDEHAVGIGRNHPVSRRELDLERVHSVGQYSSANG